MTTVIADLKEAKGLRKKELDILAYLRENSRHTVTQMGKKLGIPRTTVFEKIKKFRRLGFVQRYTAIVDFDKLGHRVCAYVLFKCETSQKEALGEALTSSTHTNNVMKLGNEFDFAAHLIFTNMNEMHSYLDILSQKYNISEASILYIAKDLKREGFLANTNAPDMTSEEEL
jgi:DNA-binding Lrp family transcriptional regulator